ncbi:MAG: TolC family protein [Chitinophagaceae bacterium]|nr:TolC family protein [Chitinophagaceae bacterium]
MKPYTKNIFLIALCILVLKGVSGQKPGIQVSPVKDTTIILPPLVDLIDSALKHNASVRYRNLDIQVRESGLKTTQNYWLRNMGFQADTRYGTFDNFSSTATTQSTTMYTATSKQFNYGLGLYLKLPLGDILDRKNEIKGANAQLEQARAMEEAQQDEIRQMVIRQYQEVLLKQRLLNIRSLNLGNARVNMEMVEKQFANGLIPVAEYVRISDIISTAELAYESARSEFITSKMILEDIIGFRLTMPASKQ